MDSTLKSNTSGSNDTTQGQRAIDFATKYASPNDSEADATGGGSSESSSGAGSSSNGCIKEKKVVLKPGMESLLFDIKKNTSLKSNANEEVLLQFEQRMLQVTSSPLYLLPTPNPLIDQLFYNQQKFNATKRPKLNMSQSFQFPTAQQQQQQQQEKLKPPTINILTKPSNELDSIKDRMFQYFSTNSLMVLTYECRPRGTNFDLILFISDSMNNQKILLHQQLQQKQLQQQQQQQQQQNPLTPGVGAPAQTQSPAQPLPSTPSTPTTATNPQQQSPTSLPSQQPTAPLPPQQPNAPKPPPQQQSPTIQQQQAKVMAQQQSMSVPQQNMERTFIFESSLPIPLYLSFPLGNAAQANFFVSHLKTAYEREAQFILSYDTILTAQQQHNLTIQTNELRRRVEF
eukprot:gene9970-11640_t